MKLVHRLSRRKIGISFLLALVYVGITMFPLYSALLTALSPFGLISTRMVLPASLHYQNFIEVFVRMNMARHIFNSFVYALGTTICVLVVAIPASYAVSRFRFRAKTPFMFFLILTQMVPQITVIIPLYLLVRSIGLTNTYIAPILVISVVCLPFPIWMLRSYFDALPIELEESGMVDGCTRFAAMRRITLPSAAPGIFAAVILCVTFTWSQFLIPLVMVTETSLAPVTVAIYRMTTEFHVLWNLVMAATIVSIVIPVMVFFFSQKWIVAGLTAGSVK